MEKTTTDLERYFRTNDKRLINKWNHYFDIYDRHFNRFRGKEIVILEIGVFQGGSLQMWKDYFGGNAKIYGIDVNPKCKNLEEENIEIFIGDQADRLFLRSVKKIIPMIDILIDDGGHTMIQQKVSFEELFPQVKNGGVYVCEDTHTSYWSAYGGGFKRPGTFIEYSKKFVDHLNAYHSKEAALRINGFTRTVDSIHYYDSVVVIEKKRHDQPFIEKSGNMSFEWRRTSRDLNGRLIKKAFMGINIILGLFKLPGIR